MGKEYYGMFINREGNKNFKTDCRVVLNDDKILIYSNNDEKIKLCEYSADCIFSFEDEKLIKISKRVSLLPEILWAFFGALAFPFSFWTGLIITGFSFLRVVSKPSKSYIILCKPLLEPVNSLRLLKVCGIKSKEKTKFKKTA